MLGSAYFAQNYASIICQGLHPTPSDMMHNIMSCEAQVAYLYVHCRCVWQAYVDENTPTNVKLETIISVYKDQPVVYFTVVYTSGLTNASIPNINNNVLSSFPSFIVEETSIKRGYTTWHGGRKCITIEYHNM